MSDKKKSYDEDKVTLFQVDYDGHLIQRAARGMSLAEVCDMYGYSSGDLQGEDKKFLIYNYQKGRAAGIDSAIDYLFKHMQAKGGAGACTSYLVRFAKDWEENEAADKDVAGKKSFKITFAN